MVKACVLNKKQTKNGKSHSLAWIDDIEDLDKEMLDLTEDEELVRELEEFVSSEELDENLNPRDVQVNYSGSQQTIASVVNTMRDNGKIESAGLLEDLARLGEETQKLSKVSCKKYCHCQKYCEEE